VTASAATAADSVDDAFAVAQKTERVWEDLARRVRPAVVNIRRFVRDEAWWNAAHKGAGTSGWRVIPADDLLHPGLRPAGGASGFMVSDSGHVLTLRRVVVDPATQRAADLIDVELDSEHYVATVLSLEPTLDLAILRIQPKKPAPFLKLGESQKVRAGQWAIAFGDPDGAERTMVPGIIAYEPSRECYQDEMSATYLQTSMRVNDGSLGGPERATAPGWTLARVTRCRRTSPPTSTRACWSAAASSRPGWASRCGC
jgi:S1-C subfamily serine protease